MSGMPQGRDINESGVKGVTLVTIEDDGQVTLEERPVGAAVFERVSLDLTGAADWSGMLETARRQLALLCKGLPEADLILRITLTGTTPLAWRLRRDFDLLQGELANVAAGVGRCWIEKVETLFASFDTHASRIAVDPIGELTALVENEVLSAFAFRADMRAVAQELLPHLPAELRHLLAADEATLDDLVENAALSGSADVLSHLHGRSAVEGID
jgi:hypothetical protein